MQAEEKFTKKLQMNSNRIECDIVLYGREEKPIKCHRFMLLSRCPKLLEEVIVEENSDKVSRSVIPLISYSHKAVKAFLWYVYTGNVESNEELLIEVEDIAKPYDVEILKSTEKATTKTTVDLCSVVVQTDSILTEDIYTMTEDFNSPEPSPFENSSFNPIIDDLNINTTGEDLFKNYETGTASPSYSPITSREADSADQNCDDDSDDDNKSVDLFEDLDCDWERPSSKEEPVRLSFNRTLLERPNKSTSLFCKEKLRQQQTLPDDEDYLRELATPFSSTVRDSIISQKKRSRSVSPVLDNSGNLYTATQVAEILQTRRDGGDVLEYMNKAIKKQKLDFNDDNFNECNENSDSELGQISLREFIENRSFNDENNANVTLSNHSVVDVYGNSLQCETPRRKNDTDKSLRKTFSTPNLCTNESPNGISPFYNHQKQFDYDDLDALADACDDSLFAKIPEEAFSPKSNSSRLSSMRSDTANILPSTTSQPSHTPSRSRRHFSPRNLISEDDTPVIENGQNKKKGLQKKKGKPNAPKVKLPSRKASNKTTLSQPPLVDQSIANNGKSPMLNYSLIDTPILKEELRRYGIKPLPRSKAKVLLRHIYKETHK